jgi:thiamine-monophosphate kinase
MIPLTSILDEEEIIHQIWKKSSSGHKDPFDDDVAWFKNQNRKFIVCKADMLVAATDAPKQMSPFHMGRKAVVSCVSDFAAKGVKPICSVVSIGLPRNQATRAFIDNLARGFRAAEKEYGLKIIAGDTNATSADTVIDCQTIGVSNSIVKRRNARPGDLVGVTGTFGHQRAGLLILLGIARSKDPAFRRVSTSSVLLPRARLDSGLKMASFLTSSIDSSDGLALSLYHLAESSKVDLMLDKLPISRGVESFASENKLDADDLALFGGEEFELVFTFDPRFQADLSKIGMLQIGRVVKKSGINKSVVYFDGRKIRRKGWSSF